MTESFILLPRRTVVARAGSIGSFRRVTHLFAASLCCLYSPIIRRDASTRIVLLRHTDSDKALVGFGVEAASA